MLPVDVPVEDRDVRVAEQNVDDLRAVLRRPLPFGIQVEQRPVREHDDPVVTAGLLQIARQPVDLRRPDGTFGVRDVVQRDEVHALVIEGVVRGAEVLLEHAARVLRRVVLAGQEAQVLDLKAARQTLEFGHALAADGGVVGCVRQVAGEDDEVRLRADGVDRLDRARQGHVGFRVGDARIAPVRVGQLQEEELGFGARVGLAPTAGGGAYAVLLLSTERFARA